jgi:putative phosphoesterase
MRVGLISDIHGSLDALRLVWSALDRLGLADGPVLNAGDTVGYGDDPQGCIDFLRARANILTVQGNYDRNVARFPEREAEYRKKWGRARPAKFKAIQRDSHLLTPDARAWLLALPRERQLDLGGTHLLLTHYAPGVKEGLGRWTSPGRLAHHAAQTDARVVVCGHTHSPFARIAGGTLFVNPGTVGRALSGNPAYAILTLDPSAAPDVLLKQVTP